jgi:hypothetical protein
LPQRHSSDAAATSNVIFPVLNIERVLVALAERCLGKLLEAHLILGFSFADERYHGLWFVGHAQTFVPAEGS